MNTMFDVQKENICNAMNHDDKKLSRLFGKSIRLATVFSGIGAVEQAFKQMKIQHEIVFACDNGERYLPQTKEEIVASIERDKPKSIESYVKSLYDATGKINWVKRSYFANYDIDEDRWHEDIRFLNGAQYQGKIDILVGGSPCQSFSTYGKKRGLEDTRGTLFYDYGKLIAESRPKVFIYENVRGLLTHDHKRTWETMKVVFDQLDYDIYPMVLNAQDYGIPQLRVRFFAVGFRRDLNVTRFKIPPPVKSTKKSTDYLDPKVDNKYYLGKKGFEWVTDPDKNLRRSRTNQDVIGCQTANQQFNWIGDFRVETPTEEMLHNPKIYIGEYQGLKSVARQLTPDECLRLMGFESFKHAPDINDKVLWRQAGNSIAVPVLKAIITQIMKV